MALTAAAAASLAAAVSLLAAAGAEARDPGRWLLTGASQLPARYWQGVTSDPGARNVFFVGVFQGLWRTTPRLREVAGRPLGIPSSVAAVEGYTHTGDLSYPRAERGRLLLP